MDQPHQRVAAALLRRLDAGEWVPGEQLPSWRSLAAEYGVGQGTVRLAIDILRARGRVEGKPRRRLTVAYPPTVRTLVDPDGEWPYGRGDTASGVRRASPRLLERLHAVAGSVRWERRELLDARGRLGMLITTYTPSWISQTDYARVWCEVSVHALAMDEAHAIGLAPGAAALLVERTRYAADGIVVQVADLVLPADRWRVGWQPELTLAHDDHS